MAHPYTDGALALITRLEGCLAAAGLALPQHRGVVWCTECIFPGCCDHLVAVLEPRLGTKSCVAASWEVPVLYGKCYQPCAGTDTPGEWLGGQLLLASQLEDALQAFLSCGSCAGCSPPIRVQKFCEGGCAGFRLTYDVRPVIV